MENTEKGPGQQFLEEMFAAKQKLNMSFAELARLLECSEVWIASVFYGQAKPSSHDIAKIASFLNMGYINPNSYGLTSYFPDRGTEPQAASDPFLYRLHELVNVYGIPIKAIVNEKFGDGVMSAIDCTLHVDKVKEVEGDRVKLTIEGKFLPYKKW